MPVPLTMGPALAADRDSTSAPSVVGVTPAGDALAVAPATSGGLTLLAFLSTGCATCAGFWEAFRQPDHLGLPAGTRLVVVTKGPEREIPGEVASLAAPGLRVVMSSDAWTDYEVPGSPFFVLVDGRSGRRIGEGVANRFEPGGRAGAAGRGGRPRRSRSTPGRDGTWGSTGRSASRPTTPSCGPPASCPATPASTRRRSRTSTARPTPDCRRRPRHVHRAG